MTRAIDLRPGSDDPAQERRRALNQPSRGVEEHKLRLRDYYARHGTVPSIAALAELWGFASKSSAARVVETLLAEGFLERAPGRRLRPGPAFASRPRPAGGADIIDEAVSRWVHAYGEDPARGYELTVRILRLAWAIQAGIERNAALEGLAAGELLVLDALYRTGPPYQETPTALKNYFLISLAGVGKRVDRLQRLGLVDRVRDPRDGRSVLVQLNEKGREVLARLVEVDRRAPHIAWSNRLSPADQTLLSRLLRQAQQEVDSFDAAARSGELREPAS